jgi:hypothetical protein
VPADVQIQALGVQPSPLEYIIPAAQELAPKVCFASFNGAAAGGPFLPCLQIISPAGYVVGTFAAPQVAAGGSADISWFPGLASQAGASSPSTLQVPILVDTPDAAGNGFPLLSTRQGFLNVRRLLPGFINGADGTWEGAIRVPEDYTSGATLTLSFVANAVAGTLRSRVSTAVVANGSSEDTAYADEAYVNTVVPATANLRFDVVTVLSTNPVAGSTLNVKVTRNGLSGADTLATIALLFECILQYTS